MSSHQWIVISSCNVDCSHCWVTWCVFLLFVRSVENWTRSNYTGFQFLVKTIVRIQRTCFYPVSFPALIEYAPLLLNFARDCKEENDRMFGSVSRRIISQAILWSRVKTDTHGNDFFVFTINFIDLSLYRALYTWIYIYIYCNLFRFFPLFYLMRTA